VSRAGVQEDASRFFDFDCDYEAEDKEERET